MRKIALGIFAIVILMVIAIVIVIGSDSKESNQIELKKTLKCKFFEKNDFDRQVINAAIDAQVRDKNLIGGVVPHHLLAGDMIASFLKSLENRNIDTLIIVGPNHRREGKYKVLTSDWDFDTPFGELKTDNIDLSDNRLSRLVGSDFDVMENEHSIGGLIPYVKYYFPDVKVIPIILSGDLGRENTEVLSETLVKGLNGKECFVLGSIDFSHYLDLETANKMDEYTIDSIKKWNKSAISEMTNDNIDSPPTMLFMLHTMELLGAQNICVAGHSNSALIARSQYDNTTSYFTLGFYR